MILRKDEFVKCLMKSSNNRVSRKKTSNISPNFRKKKEAGIYQLFTVGNLHVHISAKHHEKKHDEMIFLSGDIPPNMTPPLK